MSNSRNIYGPTTIAPKQHIPEGHEFVVTLGDLHGNPLVLMETLIHYGLAIQLKDGAHQALAQAYLEFLDDGQYDPSTFINALANFSFFNQNAHGDYIAIRLIGDMFADRGNNDYFTLLVLEKMFKAKIPFTIILSNHDYDFMMATIQLPEFLKNHQNRFPYVGITPYEWLKKKKKFIRSFYELEEWVNGCEDNAEDQTLYLGLHDKNLRCVAALGHGQVFTATIEDDDLRKILDADSYQKIAEQDSDLLAILKPHLGLLLKAADKNQIVLKYLTKTFNSEQTLFKRNSEISIISSSSSHHSLSYFYQMMNKFDLIKRNEIYNHTMSIFEKIYLPSIKLMDVEVNHDAIVLFTHAVIGPEGIRDLALSFGEQFDDSTPQALSASIMKLNNHSPTTLEKLKQLMSLYGFKNKKHAIHQLIWQRFKEIDQPLDVFFPAKINDYSLTYVVGHDTNDDLTLGNVIQINQLVGKLSWPKLKAKESGFIPNDVAKKNDYTSLRKIPRCIYGPTSIAPKQDIPAGHELVVTLGDLHGNPMILMETLVHYGLAVQADDKALEELGHLYLDFLHQRSDDDKLTYNPSSFVTCLQQRFKFRNTNQYEQPIAIRFIGDMLADRGNNDYFTLLVLLGMNDAKIPFSVNFSNHDMGFLEAYFLNLNKFKNENQGAYPDALVTNVEFNDLCSLMNLGEDDDIFKVAEDLDYDLPAADENIDEWIESFERHYTECYTGVKDINKISTIFPQDSMAHFFRMMNMCSEEDQRRMDKTIDYILSKIFIPKLKFIDYDYDENSKTITLYTHAPVGLTIIKELAESFNVTYDDSTPQELMASIDQINAHKIQMPHGLTDLINNRAFNKLIWERYFNKLVSVEVDMPANINHYNVIYVHGHDNSSNHVFAHIKQVDDIIGKVSFPEWEAKKYQFIYRYHHHQYVATRPIDSLPNVSKLSLFTEPSSPVTPSVKPATISPNQDR